MYSDWVIFQKTKTCTPRRRALQKNCSFPHSTEKKRDQRVQVKRKPAKAKNYSKGKTLAEEKTPSPKDPRLKTLPVPPENPRQQVQATLSVCGAILCLLLTTAIIVYLFYRAKCTFS